QPGIVVTVDMLSTGVDIPDLEYIVFLRPVKSRILFEQLIPDDVWGTQHIIAQGNHIVIKVNDKVVTDYTDEKDTYTKGYLALQQHNKGSVVQYRNLMFRPLPPQK